MDNRQTASRLSSLDPEFADHVRQIEDEAALRQFAGKCAAMAIALRGNGDRRSLMAIETCQRYAQGQASKPELKAKYDAATQAAEQADKTAFEARDAFEKGKASASDYTIAFDAAGAAFSARDCCEESALSAAREAAYEAWAALRTVAECEIMTPDGQLPAEISERAIDAGIIAALKTLLEDLISSTPGKRRSF